MLAPLDPRLAPSPASATFHGRKQIGTTAEHCLAGILTAAGAVVVAHQHLRDAARPDAPGAAVAHAAAGPLHLPDLSAMWPAPRRLHFEAKAKHPLRKGGWGWDTHALSRAVAWSRVSGDPVVYAIRDLDAAPLPAPGTPDDPLHWYIASTWRLLHAATRMEVEGMSYWAAEEFHPLPLLLDGLCAVAPVPVVWMPDGPLIL